MAELLAEIAIATAHVAAERLVSIVDEHKVKVFGAIIAVIRNTGPSAQQAERERKLPKPLEEMSLNSYALLRAYVLMAVTGLGFLALTWSTVVLLGGFVTTLGKEDFWCLTSISMIQAARIFNDAGDNLFPIFVNLTEKLVRKVLANPLGAVMQIFMEDTRAKGHSQTTITVVWVQVVLFILQILCIPVLVVVLTAGTLYVSGPVACVMLSLWRLRQHDYGNTPGDDSKANLVPALTIFYSLVIFQGVLYFLWRLIEGAAMLVVVSFCLDCKLPPKWGTITVVDYLHDIRAKCWRDPTSIHGRNFINYVVDLVNSESEKDYLSGVRMLHSFIEQKADVRSLLLPSRPKIKKLIDTLGWSNSSRELREVVARIIAYLAGDIHLSQFPGATYCISSMLDTTLPYWNNQQGLNHYSPVSESNDDTVSAMERLISVVRGIEEHGKKKDAGAIEQDGVDSSTDHGSKGDGWNELILQGLTILDRLAFDQQNCNDICNTPGLLPKIMAPLYSETLIQDINVSAWADVANGSLKVLHRLICAPEWIGKTDLIHKICSNEHALSNLERILYQGKNDGTEVQMRAIEILTELAIDSSTNLSTETQSSLIKKQMKIFLTDNEGEEDKLRVTAGKSLALLSKMETISKFIMEEQDKEDLQNNTVDCRNEIVETKNNIVVRLSEILDAKKIITYRTVALEILENLCTHCTLDKKYKDYVKEALLPKVLKEVLAASKRYLTREERLSLEWARSLPDNRQTNAMKKVFATRKREENEAISGPGNDEENQAISEPVGDEENQATESRGSEENQSISEPESYEKNQVTESRGSEEDQSISEPESDDENQAISGRGDDEEKKQLSKHSGQIKSPDLANKELKGKMEFREALLSLTLVIRAKQISAEEFNIVAQTMSLREGEFVVKLRTIVEKYCKARVDCLRIVKLCGQIAVLMLQPSQDTAQLKEFLKSLKKASKIMSNLESCMLFAGTDCGVKKTARPLLSDFVEKVRNLVRNKNVTVTG